MLGWIREKMATRESAPGGGRSSTFGSIVVGNDASAYNGLCIIGGACSIAVGNGF
jgi:hypothetical protein